MPLASDDRDTVLDLQSAFARCYDQGNFAGQIDYKTDPAGDLGRRRSQVARRPAAAGEAAVISD